MSYRAPYRDVAALLGYDEFTGIVFWKVGWGRVRAGDRAGRKDAKGYLRVGLFGQKLRVHHVAWLLHHKVWPKRLDHKDGDRANNRIANLREATHALNCQNRTATRLNKSGLIGAHQAWGGRFKSEISVNGQRYQLGIFETAEIAHEAYCLAKRVLHTFNPEVRPLPKEPDGFAGALTRELGIKFAKDANGISLPRLHTGGAA